jgi:hypothetical protein
VIEDNIVGVTGVLLVVGDHGDKTPDPSGDPENIIDNITNPSTAVHV